MRVGHAALEIPGWRSTAADRPVGADMADLPNTSTLILCPLKGRLAVTNNNLPKVGAALEMAVGVERLLEREYPINYGP